MARWGISSRLSRIVFQKTARDCTDVSELRPAKLAIAPPRSSIWSLPLIARAPWIFVNSDEPSELGCCADCSEITKNPLISSTSERHSGQQPTAKFHRSMGGSRTQQAYRFPQHTFQRMGLLAREADAVAQGTGVTLHLYRRHAEIVRGFIRAPVVWGMRRVGRPAAAMVFQAKVSILQGDAH
eukprot:scaffold1954_cov364-Prasinococcus_capsulatus_cf.AAC.16